MDDSADIWITCIGDAYKQPIADLVENLHRRYPRLSYMEKDYSLPIILLSVAMFESYMARAAYLSLSPEDRKRIPELFEESVVKGQLKTGYDIFQDLYASYPKISEIREVYVLRDALTHNHLWEYTTDGEVIRRILGGNKAYKENVDFDTLTTKTLKLPILPGHQTWQTARSCFKAIWDAFGYVESSKPVDVLSRCGSFYVHVGTSLSSQFPGQRTVSLSELFLLPLPNKQA